jgi:hypothetical protein
MKYTLNSQHFVDFLADLTTDDCSNENIKQPFQNCLNMHDFSSFITSSSLSLFQKLSLIKITIPLENTKRTFFSVQEIIESIARNDKNDFVIDSICHLDQFPDFAQFDLFIDGFESGIGNILDELLHVHLNELPSKFVIFTSSLIEGFCLQRNNLVKNQDIKYRVRQFASPFQHFNQNAWFLLIIYYDLILIEGNQDELQKSYHELFEYLLFSISNSCDVNSQDILFMVFKIGSNFEFENIGYYSLSSVAFLMSGFEHLTSPLEVFFST